MVRLSEAFGKKDELAENRIKDGRNIRFVEPTTCPKEVKTFLDEARYWFGRGEHLTDKGVRRKLDVQMLDYRNLNGVIIAVVQVNRDRIEAWQKYAKRKVVYHLASCSANSPKEISDSPIFAVTGQRLHWYVRHNYSPLSWLAKCDPALFKEVLSNQADLLPFVQADIEAATSEGGKDD